jgi:mRNA interferase MazF
MNIKRGDVVLLDYPFSDSTGTKVRPALVVQSDAYNAKLNSTIVALITKNLTRVIHEPSQMLIDIGTPEGQASGLRMSSAVVCTNLFTVHERHVIKTIGHLSARLMTQVSSCLKAALDLT